MWLPSFEVAVISLLCVNAVLSAFGCGLLIFRRPRLIERILAPIVAPAGKLPQESKPTPPPPEKPQPPKPKKSDGPTHTFEVKL